MNNRAWWVILVGLLVVIIGLAWLLFSTPAPAPEPGTSATTTTPTPSPTPAPVGNEPLSKKVVVTSPASGASVGKTFVVSGNAPGQWYFEAVFPIQVRDKDGNKIAQAQGQAQGDWMTTDQVTFTSTITISNYSGPATLILLKDNPSGLPENDDSIEVPIVIQ